MSKNLALEKVGRAKVAYELQLKGWLVGEAFDDGFDLLAVKNEKIVCKIELKTMDIRNRGEKSNLTAPISKKEKETCTHIIVYLEPDGLFFIAKKEKIITNMNNIFAALNKKTRKIRVPKNNSFSFAKYENAWEELEN